MIVTENGKIVHNFLMAPEDIETTWVADGIRNFRFLNRSVPYLEDLILKWAEDKVNKTVWEVISVNTGQVDQTGHFEHGGRMKDLCFHKELTAKITAAVREADEGFI